MQETREMCVWSLGREDPLKEEMATHSSILAWKIPWTEEPDRLQSMESQRVGHNWVTNTFTFKYFKYSEIWALMNKEESILASKIPRTEEPGGLQSMGLQRVGHDWATSTLWLRASKKGRKKKQACSASPVELRPLGWGCSFKGSPAGREGKGQVRQREELQAV